MRIRPRTLPLSTSVPISRYSQKPILELGSVIYRVDYCREVVKREDPSGRSLMGVLQDYVRIYRVQTRWQEADYVIVASLHKSGPVRQVPLTSVFDSLDTRRQLITEYPGHRTKQATEELFHNLQTLARNVRWTPW